MLDYEEVILFTQKVFDRDVVGSDDFMGEASLELTDVDLRKYVKQLDMDSSMREIRIRTCFILRVGHREIFDINVPHTHRQTDRQTDVLHVQKF